MHKVTKTVYIDNEGAEHDTEEEALDADDVIFMSGVLKNLDDIYWRDPEPREVAANLRKLGYTIVQVANVG